MMRRYSLLGFRRIQDMVRHAGQRNRVDEQGQSTVGLMTGRVSRASNPLLVLRKC